MNDFAKDELLCMKRRIEHLKMSIWENNFIMNNVNKKSSTIKITCRMPLYLLHIKSNLLGSLSKGNYQSNRSQMSTFVFFEINMRIFHIYVFMLGSLLISFTTRKESQGYTEKIYILILCDTSCVLPLLDICDSEEAGFKEFLEVFHVSELQHYIKNGLMLGRF